MTWRFEDVMQVPPDASVFDVPSQCSEVCDSKPCQFFRQALGEGVTDTEDFMHKMHF